METILETLIPLQPAGLQPIRFGAEKGLPRGEVLLDLPFEGVLPDVPENFSDFLNSLSGNPDDVVKENPVSLEAFSDFEGMEPVMDTDAGIHKPSPPPQAHEMSINPECFFKNTGIVPDDVVPQPDASYGDTTPGDTTGQIDPETLAGRTPAPVVGTRDPVIQMDPEQIIETSDPVVQVAPEYSRSLSTGSVQEDTPHPHVSEEGNTDSSYLQVRIDPAGVYGHISDTQRLETAGGGFVSELVELPNLEGTPMVSSAAQDAGEPKPTAAGNNNPGLPVAGHVLPAGRDSEASQKVAMILPVLENEKAPQADVRGRVSLVLTETSEKISPQGSLPPMGQDVSGNFLEGRDRGYSAPLHGNKPGMLNSRFEPGNVHVGTTVPTVIPESAAPGAFQTSDPDNLLQIEKMTWSLTGPPGTAVSEKGDALEAVRLPLEPREIRTLTDIIEKAVWRQENGRSRARIQLKPAFLGHLHLNVVMDQLKVTVEIRAETLLARDFLETKLHVLKADLQESGLEIDKIDVLVDPDLSNQQEQGPTSGHKQTHRLNGHLKEVETLTDADPTEAGQVISSGTGENQIDCFA